MAGMSHDNVIENFDFQKLTGSNEIPSDFDVCLRWSRITTRMIVAHDEHDGNHIGGCLLSGT